MCHQLNIAKIMKILIDHVPSIKKNNENITINQLERQEKLIQKLVVCLLTKSCHFKEPLQMAHAAMTL